VKGKVIIDAFRNINPQYLMANMEPRQTTSNITFLNKPSIQALVHGLNRFYYSIAITYRKNDLEAQMLMNLHKKKWTRGLTLPPATTAKARNTSAIETLVTLTELYAKRVAEEEHKSPEEVAVANVGKIDPKKRLEVEVASLMATNIVDCMGAMLDTVVF